MPARNSNGAYRLFALPSGLIIFLLSLGVTPFLLGGAVKWAIAAAVLPLAWRALGRR